MNSLLKRVRPKITTNRYGATIKRPTCACAWWSRITIIDSAIHCMLLYLGALTLCWLLNIFCLKIDSSEPFIKLKISSTYEISTQPLRLGKVCLLHQTACFERKNYAIKMCCILDLQFSFTSINLFYRHRWISRYAIPGISQRWSWCTRDVWCLWKTHSRYVKQES